MFVEKGKLEMNPSVFLGTVAILIGLAAWAGVLVSRTNPAVLFWGGISMLFLCSALGFLGCYASGDWTKCLVPVGGFLIVAAGLLINRRPRIERLDKLVGTKDAMNNSESSEKVHDGQ